MFPFIELISAYEFLDKYGNYMPESGYRCFMPDYDGQLIEIKSIASNQDYTLTLQAWHTPGVFFTVEYTYPIIATYQSVD